jgi:ABC-2 type transport system permease protein
LIRIVFGALRAQFEMTRRNMMDVYWILLMPFFSVIFTAIMLHSGRTDLVGYALVAPLLIAIGQMGFYVSAELLARDQWMQTLELVVASPAPFFLVLATRISLVSSIGLLGFVESWLIARFGFGIEVPVYHPLVLLVTLLATSLASTASALVLAAFCVLMRNVRTLQNSATYPLYVLGGVLVPTTYLPEWLQPASKLVFLSWSADLLRDSLQAATPSDVPLRVAAILALGLGTGTMGAILLQHMLDRLRSEGRLGLL